MLIFFENSDADKMLAKGLGLTPTVTSLDMFASEVIREVDEAIIAFEFLAEKNELETDKLSTKLGSSCGGLLPQPLTCKQNDLS